MKAITINGYTIEPNAPAAAAAALELNNATAQASDHILIQPKAPLKPAEEKKLTQLGVEVLEAVPGEALICRYPGTDLNAIRALSFIGWVEVYPRAVKLGRSLREQPSTRATHLDAAVAAPTLDATPRTVNIVLHRTVDQKKAVANIAKAAHCKEKDVVVRNGRVRLRVTTRRLPELASVDEVRHIEEVREARLYNTAARGVLRMPTDAAARGAEGKGEVVAVADTGFDKGSTTDVHPAFKGRVQRLYALGRTNRSDDPDGHGTHVAGSVLGNGSSTTVGPVRGTATAAKLVLQSVLDANGGLGGIPDDLSDLFHPPYQNDTARIHTNSWGFIDSAGEYGQASEDLDRFVHKNRDLLVLFAAGNDGADGDANGVIDPGSVGPPGTAKNCLTVGACENDRPDIALTYGQGFGYPADPIRSDRMADDPDGMVAFSSRGPVNDGRIKPDVVAPGTFILSTRSRVTTSQGWGATADPLFMFNGGTSMATPLVAGCAAVIRNYMRQVKKLKAPSAALMKAAIINGAHNLGGQYSPSEAGGTPNHSEGFGRVDVRGVVGPHAAGTRLSFQDEGAGLRTGQEKLRRVKVSARNRALKVTLVWTDPPGEGLQSDLDLIVRIGKTQRHGNMPARSRAFDRKNNVEQVVWTLPPTGVADIIVRAHRVTHGTQNYALVIRVQ